MPAIGKLVTCFATEENDSFRLFFPISHYWYLLGGCGYPHTGATDSASGGSAHRESQRGLLRYGWDVVVPDHL